MRLRRLALVLAAAAAAFPAHAASLLVPHRAVYDLNLDRASDRSGITGISGRMVYEFSGSRCEGYSVKFRFVTQIDTSEVSRVTDQQTTTYEDAAGDSFSFVTKSFVDQTLDKEVRGTAMRGSDGTKVEIEKPEQTDLELASTQFPTQHLLELIDKAEAGESFYETTLFDGSDDADEVLTTTVIIGDEAQTPRTDPEFGVMTEPSGFWPVTIAYFDTSGEGEEVPIYSISFKLHDNGITRDLMMDYGDFSMKGKLVDLSLFEAQSENCPAR